MHTSLLGRRRRLAKGGQGLLQGGFSPRIANSLPKYCVCPSTRPWRKISTSQIKKSRQQQEGAKANKLSQQNQQRSPAFIACIARIQLHTFPEACLSVIFLISSSSCAPFCDTYTTLVTCYFATHQPPHIFLSNKSNKHGQEEQKFQGQAIPGHSAQGSSPAQEASWSKQQQFRSLDRHQSVRECPRLVGQGIEISRPQPSHARLQPKCRPIHLPRTKHGPPQTKSPNSSRE